MSGLLRRAGPLSAVLIALVAAVACDAVHSLVDQAHRPSFPEPSAATYSAATYEVALPADRGLVRVPGAAVTADFFKESSAPPLLGRGFTAEEHGPAGVMMIGYEFWKTRFGGDPSVIGRTLRIDGRSLTIVGVVPKGFSFPNGAAIWVPR